MPGGIQNLLAQRLGNVYSLKDLNCSPLKDRVKPVLHKCLDLMLLLQHINVATATYEIVRECGEALRSGVGPRTRGHFFRIFPVK